MKLGESVKTQVRLIVSKFQKKICSVMTSLWRNSSIAKREHSMAKGNLTTPVLSLCKLDWKAAGSIKK